MEFTTRQKDILGRSPQNSPSMKQSCWRAFPMLPRPIHRIQIGAARAAHEAGAGEKWWNAKCLRKKRPMQFLQGHSLRTSQPDVRFAYCSFFSSAACRIRRWILSNCCKACSAFSPPAARISLIVCRSSSSHIRISFPGRSKRGLCSSTSASSHVGGRNPSFSICACSS